MNNMPVQMAIIGTIIFTSKYFCEKIPAIINAVPDKYIAPKNLACNGGTNHGMAWSTFVGIKYPHTPTHNANKPTATK